MPKTILHIIDSLNTGGAEVLLAGVVASMKNYNHIVATLNPKNHFKNDIDNEAIHVLDYKNKWSLPSTVRKIRKIIREQKVDIIHTHLLTSTFVGRVARPKKIPFFFTVHNILSESAFKKHKLSFLLEKYLYSSTQNVIFVSENVREDYQKAVGIKGSEFLLPNYVNDVFFNSEWTKTNWEPNSPLRFISIGILKDQKNFKFLIETLSKFEREFTLDIYGDGPEKEELSEKIRKHNLENSIFLKGYNNKLFKVLKNYDLFIMPSKFEGYGISMMEAMATGLPTLVSDISTLRNVSHGASVYFDPYDGMDLLSKLSSMINDVELMKSKSLEGRNLANEKSRKQIYIKKLSEIYNHQ